MKLPDHFQKRVGMTTVGVIFCALAVGFFKCSSFGVDPFQCFARAPGSGCSGELPPTGCTT